MNWCFNACLYHHTILHTPSYAVTSTANWPTHPLHDRGVTQDLIKFVAETKLISLHKIFEIIHDHNPLNTIPTQKLSHFYHHHGHKLISPLPQTWQEITFYCLNKGYCLLGACSLWSPYQVGQLLRAGTAAKHKLFHAEKEFTYLYHMNLLIPAKDVSHIRNSLFLIYICERQFKSNPVHALS